MNKEIRLNAFDMNCVGHIQHGMWTHPRDRSTEYNTIRYWQDLARLSEVLAGCEIQVDVAAELVDATTPIDSNMTEGVPGGVEKHIIVATESIIIMNIAPRLGRIGKFRRGDRMLY